MYHPAQIKTTYISHTDKHRQFTNMFPVPSFYPDVSSLIFVSVAPPLLGSFVSLFSRDELFLLSFWESETLSGILVLPQSLLLCLGLLPMRSRMLSFLWCFDVCLLFSESLRRVLLCFLKHIEAGLVHSLFFFISDCNIVCFFNYYLFSNGEPFVSF